jgi:hypothetical protein
MIAVRGSAPYPSGDDGLAEIRLGDGKRVWVKCQDVTD